MLVFETRIAIASSRGLYFILTLRRFAMVDRYQFGKKSDFPFVSKKWKNNRESVRRICVLLKLRFKSSWGN